VLKVNNIWIFQNELLEFHKLGKTKKSKDRRETSPNLTKSGEGFQTSAKLSRRLVWRFWIRPDDSDPETETTNYIFKFAKETFTIDLAESKIEGE
jgi:hypothetical protein